MDPRPMTVGHLVARIVHGEDGSGIEVERITSLECTHVFTTKDGIARRSDDYVLVGLVPLWARRDADFSRLFTFVGPSK
jgi:hypothetical protein